MAYANGDYMQDQGAFQDVIKFDPGSSSCGGKQALAERHGAAEISEVRRQRTEWQRSATRELATARTEGALERYEAAGMVQGHATQAETRTALVDG